MVVELSKRGSKISADTKGSHADGRPRHSVGGGPVSGGVTQVDHRLATH